MDFMAKIKEYKESNSSKSPIWIWFNKGKESGICLICGTFVQSSNYATTNLILHLKRHHGIVFRSKVDSIMVDINSILLHWYFTITKKCSEAV